jgi:acetyl-CoA C-acetyltransferase
MSRRVGIVGAAITPFRARWVEKTYYELAQMCTAAVTEDAGIGIGEVDGVVYGIYNDLFQRACIPEHPLQGIIGMQNKFGIRVSNGGATGAYAMSAAHAYVASGRYDVMLVLGVEKATDCFDFVSLSATPEVIKVIGWSGDSFFEQKLGWTAADSYSEVVLAYMDEHPGDLRPEVTAQISAILSEQVRDNPFAQRRHDQVTAEEVLGSRYVTYPFKQFETCVYSEGAAAVILAEEGRAETIARNTGQPVIWITGVGEANEHSFAGRGQKTMHRILSDHLAARSAYRMAGISDPTAEIDVVEAHDAFVQQLQITLAEMGFVPLGRADALIEEGIMAPGGRLLVNPSGGLTYCGHAVGASNIMSAWSARRELINRGLHRAAVHGTGSTVAQYGVVMILERDS